MSRTKKAFGGLLVGYLGTFITTLMGFILTPIILNYLSPDQYGFWITSSQVLMFLGLLDFSMGLGVLRLAADPVNFNTKKKADSFVSSAFYLFLFISLIIILVGFVSAPFIPRLFNIPISGFSQVKNAFLVAVFWMAASLILSIFSMFLMGRQYIGLVNTLNVFNVVGSGLLSLFFLKNKLGLLALPLANLLMVIIIAGITYLFCIKYLPDFNIKWQFFDTSFIKKIWNVGVTVQAGKLANTVAVSADNIIIASSLGANAVPSYSLTGKMPILISSTIASAIGSVISPAIAQLYSEKKYQTIKTTYLKVVTIIVRFSIFSSVYLSISNYIFIKLWVGKSYYGGNWLMLIYIFWALQNSFISATAVFVWLSEERKGFALASIIEAIINLVSSIILVRYIGVIGVALGTTIAKSCTLFIYLPYKTCAMLDIQVHAFFTTILVSCFKSIPTIIFGLLLYYYIPSNPGWLWLVYSGTILIIINLFSFELVKIIRQRPSGMTELINGLMKLEYTI